MGTVKNYRGKEAIREHLRGFELMKEDGRRSEAEAKRVVKDTKKIASH